MTVWQDEALCAETDPEAFFPEGGETGRRAKKICGRCPVAKECLDYALGNDITFGIWGGTSPKERVELQGPRGPVPKGLTKPRTVEWADVVAAHSAGVPVGDIAERFTISERSVYRIVAESRAA